MGLSAWYEQLQQRWQRELWEPEKAPKSWPGRLLIAILRHGWIVGHGFRENRLAPQAASLTYASLLALVPFLLLAFVAARGMNMHTMLHDAATDFFGAHLPQAAQEFIRSAVRLVEDTNTIPLGVAGLVILTLSILHLMRTIHLSLNRIWRVHRRPFSWGQVAAYALITLFGPLALLTAAWIPLLLQSFQLVQWIRTHFGGLAVVVEPAGQLTYVVAALTIIYRFVPSCRVRWWPAAFGGIVAGVLWVGWQHLCAFMQSGVSSYNAIYGAFSVLPVVLIWMYTNWTILLIGAELSFAHQYHDCYDPDSERIRPASLEAVLLAAAAAAAITDCERADEPFDTAAFAGRYGVPEGLLREMLEQLVRSDILSSDGTTFQPTTAGESPTLADVNRSIYAMTASGLPFSRRMPERLRQTFEDARNAYLDRLGERTINDLETREQDDK